MEICKWSKVQGRDGTGLCVQVFPTVLGLGCLAATAAGFRHDGLAEEL